MDALFVPQIFGPIKLKCGDAREDGKLFWHYYTRKGVVRQQWVTPEAFTRNKQKSEINQTKRLKELKKERRAAGIMPRQKVTNFKKYRCRKSREWRKNNPEKCRKMKQNWRNKNRQKVREMNRRSWLKAKPEKLIERRNRRRAREQSAPVETCQLTIGLYAIRRRVGECIGIKLHVDHIRPLKSGGAHARNNMQIIPAIWNARKGHKRFFTLPDCYITESP